eukprot:CAMPEP_0177532024 /NCGR_PEP_ID=MMETSP0369-20130122/54391_1 /TAXON_ID=447022 ORGANISM="Scrippsiella hangoei-like, Strain SHHI-4" /NCGR_SAMPLE_ID=MMETSP0369 /ASSEMBLY_ACC=CAM_ASM_000364 /LENGTH=82 /DNA_ID=CAMNT_0019013277 /DNA_START=28 /DNA_END=273 /DNA_ORIENTATION=-
MAQQIEDTSAHSCASSQCLLEAWLPSWIRPQFKSARAQHKASAVLDKGRAEMRSVYYSDCGAHGARMMSRAGSMIDEADTKK